MPVTDCRTSDDPISVSDVIAREREEIAQDRGKTDGYSALCLSGGGIRSATFSLGVLQGLARSGVLKHFDYLSTVSGGGYIGGWLTAWVQRIGFSNVNEQLASNQDQEKPEEEPQPLQQLRDYSNYLSPQTGLMNADSWTLVATFLRNMLLNWAVILPLLAAALMLPRFLIAIIAIKGGFWPIIITLSTGAALVCSPVIHEALDLPSLGDARLSRRSFKFFFLAPFIGYAVLFSIAWGWYIQMGAQAFIAAVGSTPPRLLVTALTDLDTTFALLGALFHSFVWSIGVVLVRVWKKKSLSWEKISWFICAALVSGAIGGYLLILSAESISHLVTANQPAYACFAFPLFMGAFMTAGAVQVALVRLASEETDREWWASSAAWPLIVTTAWLAGSSLVYYGPQLFYSKISTLQGTAVSLFGILSGAATAFCGHSDSTSASAQNSEKLTEKAINLLMIIAALLFIAIFLILLSLGTSWILEGRPDNFSIDQHILQLHYSHRDTLLLPTFIFFILCGVGISRFVDINRFSLHCMYRNRLIRAYLGASRKQEKRTPNALTGFDQNDNIDMSVLPLRPFHVINCALNISGNDKLSWQQRKAESFTITPLHAGGKEIGYRPISRYAAAQSSSLLPHKGISLGTAMAISGAAASPNMGYHSSPLITFIMALFNLRLGWWLGNTGSKGEKTWRSTGPKLSARIMLKEIFGRTSDHSEYIYLSDGGHFENLGLYEMVLRRCRYIVVIDAGCDRERHFEDLGNALRKIRIDLRTTITINLKPLTEGNKRCTAGTIHYPAANDKPALTGRIIYLKPLICGNEPPDIFNYHKAHDAFPHEPTSDQWFSESQFESYRMLGFHTVRDILNNDWVCASTEEFLSKIESYSEGT